MYKEKNLEKKLMLFKCKFLMTYPFIFLIHLPAFLNMKKKNTLNFEYISTTKKLFNYVLFQNKPKLRKTCFKLTLNVFLQKYDLFHKATDNP